MIDLTNLEKIHQRGENTEARCPACAEMGRDRSGNHLWIKPSGEYGCAANPKDTEHRKRIHALVGVTAKSVAPRPVVVSPPRPPRRGEPVFPADMRAPTGEELLLLQRLRKLPNTAGLELAVTAGQLFIGTFKELEGATWKDVLAWVVTDSARRNAQARRLDGNPWECLEGVKARTLKGSEASWPIGLADAKECSRILLVEGGPDFLAAWSLVAGSGTPDVRPVAMLGSGQTLTPETVQFFHGKSVTVYPHRDIEGAKALNLWATPLVAAGVSVAWHDLTPHKDLNEAISAAGYTPDGLCPACWGKGVVAPKDGPTCACRPYVWRAFTAEQVFNDGSATE